MLLSNQSYSAARYQSYLWRRWYMLVSAFYKDGNVFILMYKCVFCIVCLLKWTLSLIIKVDDDDI